MNNRENEAPFRQNAMPLLHEYNGDFQDILELSAFFDIVNLYFCVEVAQDDILARALCDSKSCNV